jgi:hypothetical protein
MDALELMQEHEAAERLLAFVRESNRIEGIRRDPTPEEIKAHKTFIARKRVKIEHVKALVSVCQPNAVLRDRETVPGVRVGNHIAPPSGPAVGVDLDKLLLDVGTLAVSPWAAHVRYECLHPFTDGNGRSGRAIWLWHMTLLGRQRAALAIGFLHNFYYQTLASRQQ